MHLNYVCWDQIYRYLIFGCDIYQHNRMLNFNFSPTFHYIVPARPTIFSNKLLLFIMVERVVYQSRQTKRAHPILMGYYPVNVWGSTPAVNVRGSTPNNVPNLPRVVRVHCTRTYPPGRPIRDQESVTTNHSQHTG